jgi:hypothetical protein
MKAATLIATVLIAGPSFARDSWTGILDRRDAARSRAAASSDNYCGTQPRSAHPKRDFRSEFACPSTGKYGGACPGWVIDHIVALKRCGRDSPSNMAWQTKAQAKRKDRWE